MKNNLFEFQDYKEYLLKVLERMPGNGHGVRSQMATAMNSQVAFVSQVLNKDAHFNLDQAEDLNKFFGHTNDEADYFLLLVQFARAGTSALKTRLSRQIEEFRKKRLLLKERVDIRHTISREDQMAYYSTWIHAAIHVMVTIPEFQTKQAIAQYFHLSLERVNESLEFLISIGLIENANGLFKPRVDRTFLPSDSVMIMKHHTNWRIKAIESFERPPAQDLHFSAVFSLSKADVYQVKEALIAATNRTRELIRKSKEEELHCLSLDFFKI